MQKCNCDYGWSWTDFYNGSEFIKGKVYFVEPVDTMGAGDSYLAALIVSLLKKGWKKGRCFAGRCDQGSHG